MKLLIINYEMNDDSPVLSWQASVARELAKRCDEVQVLTEIAVRYQGAENLRVHTMPRRPFGVPKRLGGGFLVNPQLARILRDFKPDACFIHMAARWAYCLYPVLKRHNIPVLLWYAHGSVSWRLKLALKCVDRVITSTPEGFRLPSPKVHVIGQAIDTELFDIPSSLSPRPEIVYVGRISERKRVHLMPEVLAELRRLAPDVPWRIKLVGPTLTAEDHSYIAALRQKISALGFADFIELAGSMPQKETARLYQSAALHLNLSETGSMDKTVMEALATGCPVLTTNIAFRETLKDFPDMFSASSAPAELAAKILTLFRNPPQRASLRALVAGQHDLVSWAGKVMEQITHTGAK